MEERNLKNWQEFEEAIHELEKKYTEKKNSNTNTSVSEFLFRGQADSSWRLESTLERYFKKQISLSEYYQIIFPAKSKIETFTGLQWQIPSIPEYHAWLDKEFREFIGGIKAYDYFVFLRHHSFPSPLLDWSASPYIASFFAFNNFKKTNADYISVYVFWESPDGTKSATPNEPWIRVLESDVRSHKRHFLQQSKYSICTVKTSDGFFYANHENIVTKKVTNQDLLWKFNIPVSERRKALAELNKMNINSFSLFGTEDSLLETIATTDIFLKHRDL